MQPKVVNGETKNLKLHKVTGSNSPASNIFTWICLLLTFYQVFVLFGFFC